MDVFFVALIVTLLGGPCATLNVVQKPNPASAGGIVRINCSTEHASLGEGALNWKLPNGDEIKVGTPPGARILTDDDEVTALSILQLNLTSFPPERTVSCGVDNESRESFTVCVSWDIIHHPQNVIVHDGDKGPWTLSCVVVQDCISPPNPWFYQDGKQVENGAGITVTSDVVLGTSTAVNWTLTFTKEGQDDVPAGTYTCRVPDSTASATLKMAESWIVHSPQSYTTVRKVDTAKTLSCIVAEDNTTPSNPWLDQDGEEVKNDAKNGIEVTPKQVSDTVVEWELTLTNLSEVIPKDGVHYTCSVSTGADIAVIKWADSPAIKFPLEDLTVPKRLDEPRSITCVVVGDYDHSILNPWTHDGAPANDTIANVELPIFTDDLVIYRLTFQNVQDDGVFGNYTCKVSESVFSTATLFEEKSGDSDTTTKDSSSVNPSPSNPHPGPTSTSTSVDAVRSSSDITSASEPPMFGEQTSSYAPPVNTSSPDNTPAPTTSASPTSNTTASSTPSPSPASTPKGNQVEPDDLPSKILAIAVAVVVLVILCGVVYVVYWKRHTLRDWLMDKDVVKVIKKKKKGKGYKYSKLPRDIHTSMKHLE